ncbi:helix-turn-helix transcriptional regulator [Nonomuraea recticatena]
MSVTLHERELFGGGQVLAGVHTLTGELEPHVHDFVEIAVIGEGRGTHLSSHGEHELRRGDVIVLRPGTWHGFSGCDTLTVANCCVSAAALRAEFALLEQVGAIHRLLWTDPVAEGARGVLVTRTDPDAALEAISEIRRLSAEPYRKHGEARLLGRLLTVLGTLTDGRDPVVPVSGHPAVRAATGLLAQEIARAWTMDALAGAVSLDPDYLGRLFRRHVGLSPLAYLARIRAERAATLLLHTDLPVARVGAEVGWGDPTYFARRFRSLVGLTPSQYRSAQAVANRVITASGRTDGSARRPGPPSHGSHRPPP